MKSLGIDLGTSNSVVCVYEKGDVNVVPIDGKQSVASVVYIKDGKITIGDNAKKRILLDPDNILSSTKREIGTDWSKTIEGKKYTAVDAASMLLSYIKTKAEEEQNTTFSDVVVTIPAYFNDRQREDTQKAVEKAGFSVRRLIPEPTAAAINYGFNRGIDQTIAVIDLGGGTFDVSILEIENNNFTVKAVDGNSKLGGDDFDNAISDYIFNQIEIESGKDLRSNNVARQRVKEIAEETKIELSMSLQSEITIAGLEPGLNLDIVLTRDKYRELIQEYLDEIIAKINETILAAKLNADDINRFVLVGGSCKHPVVSELIKENFREPFIARNMDTTVAEGAATVCHSLKSPKMEGEVDNRPVIKDVIAHSLGINTIEKGKGAFGKKSEVYTPILDKNTHYPQKRVFIGSTQDKWQTNVQMNVFRGEDRDVKNNTKLGVLGLKISEEHLGKNIMPIGAIFELDESGILTFTGVEIPLTEENKFEIAALIEKHSKDNKSCYMPYEEIKPLISKYNLKTVTVKIDKSVV